MKKRKIILGLMALVLGTTALASCDKNNKKNKSSVESSIVENSNISDESISESTKESDESINESTKESDESTNESKETSTKTGMATSSENNESVESSESIESSESTESNESTESSENTVEYSYDENQLLEIKQKASLLNPFEFDRCVLSLHGETLVFEKSEGGWKLYEKESAILRAKEPILLEEESLEEIEFQYKVSMMLDALTLANMCDIIVEYQLSYNYKELDDLHKLSIDLDDTKLDLYYDQLGDLFFAKFNENGLVHTVNCTLYTENYMNYFDNFNNYEATEGVEADFVNLSTESPCEFTDLVSNWLRNGDEFSCSLDDIISDGVKNYSQGYLKFLLESYLLTDVKPTDFIKLSGATTYYVFENGEDGILVYDSNGYLFGNYYLDGGYFEILTIFNNLDNITRNGVELSELEFEVILENINPTVNNSAFASFNNDSKSSYYLELDSDNWTIKDASNPTDELTKVVNTLFSDYGDINNTMKKLALQEKTYTVYRSQINGADITNIVLDSNNACYSFDDTGRLVKYNYLQNIVKISYNQTPIIDVIR